MLLFLQEPFTFAIHFQVVSFAIARRQATLPNEGVTGVVSAIRAFCE